MKYLHLCGTSHGYWLDVPDGVIVHTVAVPDSVRSTYHRVEIALLVSPGNVATFAIYVQDRDYDLLTSLKDRWFVEALADALDHPR